MCGENKGTTCCKLTARWAVGLDLEARAKTLPRVQSYEMNSARVLLLCLAGLRLPAQTTPGPARFVTDPGVITTRQAITPAGVQAIFDGRVYAGTLYETSGPFFAGAFDPNAVTVRQVGTKPALRPVLQESKRSVKGVLGVFVAVGFVEEVRLVSTGAGQLLLAFGSVS